MNSIEGYTSSGAVAQSPTARNTPHTASLLSQLGDMVAPRVGVLALSVLGFLNEASRVQAAEPAEPAVAVRVDEVGALTEVQIADATFQARFYEQALTGTLDAQKRVDSFTLSGKRCTLERPTTIENITPVLEEFRKTLALNPEAFTGDLPEKFTTRDGINFECAVDGKEIIVRDGLVGFREGSAFEARSSEAVDKKITEYRESLLSKIESKLTAAQKVEFELRALRSGLPERIQAIQKSIQSQIDLYQHIPLSRETWEDSLATFRTKIQTPYTEAEKLTTSASQLNAMKAVAEELVVFEKAHSYFNEHSHQFSLETLSQISERMSRCEGLNSRHTALTTAVRNAMYATRDYNTQQHWKTIEAEISSTWVQQIDSWGKTQGWQRWDPSSLSLEKFSAVVETLDAHLALYEEKVGIVAEKRDATITSAYRISRLEADALIGQRDHLSGKQTVQFLTADSELIMEATFLPDGTMCSREFSTPENSYVQKFEDGKISVEYVTNTTSNEKNSYYFNESGIPSMTFLRTDGQIRTVVKYHTNGAVYSESSATGSEFYTRDGSRLITLPFDGSAGAFTGYRLQNGSSAVLKTCKEEMASRENYSATSYLKELAGILGSDEKKHIFLEVCMRYTSDSTGERWQSATETVLRVEGGRMLGDCDDYAFLARELLRIEGKPAHVLYIPHHATCIWVTQDSEGKYHARTLGTYGLDHNGVRFGEVASGAAVTGFSSIKDAVNSTMKKFQYPGLGVAEGQDYKVNGTITIMNINSPGTRATTNWTTDSIISPNL